MAGTNTITATGPATYSYAATRPPIWFIPANTNTGATTINISPSGGAALGAKNVFWNGAACVGGELRQNVPAALVYDGTQFHVIANGFNAPFSDAHAVVEGSTDATKKLRFGVDGFTTGQTRVITPPDRDLAGLGVFLGTPIATTSGTTADFTGIPSGVREITVNFSGFSTNGISALILQIGDSGGIETAGYISASGPIDGAATQRTDSFSLATATVAAQTIEGQITLSLENATAFTWTCKGVLLQSSTNLYINAGSKSLSATLDRVRITTASADTFDAGEINITYKF